MDINIEVKKYIKELESLQNENRKKIYKNHGCELKCYGILISELKNIIKRDKLNGNEKIGKSLIETKIYDAMYMGFTILKSSDVTMDELIKWTGYTNFSGITTTQISWFIAENKEREDLLLHYKNINDDKHHAIYYASLASTLMIDPTFNEELVESEVITIKDTILDLNFNDTKIQMINFLASVALQNKNLATLALDTYDKVINDLEVDFGKTSCSLIDVKKYYNSASERNKLGKARKTCRC